MLAHPHVRTSFGSTFGPFGMLVARSPVYSAARAGHAKVVKLLLGAADADPNVGAVIGPFGGVEGVRGPWCTLGPRS